MWETFKAVTDCISPILTRAVAMRCTELSEVRVRAGKAVVVYLYTQPHFVRCDGTLTKSMTDSPLIVDHNELKAAFARLCSYSVYKYLDNAAQGFITARGGHRIGVCASAVVEHGEVKSVCDVTSLNIRAAKEVRGCSQKLLSAVSPDEGLLICGAPSSGKTTLLRDIARVLSFERLKKVCIVDERLEIASCFDCECGFDIGLSDVYSGYPKKHAVMLAVRTMSPDFIICDELTGDDCAAVTSALNCGVRMISAVHCDSPSAARNNTSIKTLVKTGAFGKTVFLDGKLPSGISHVYDRGECSAWCVRSV